HHLHSWFGNRMPETDQEGLIVSELGNLQRQYHPPFVLFAFDPMDYGYGFTPVFTPTDPALADTQYFSRTLDAPFQSTIGSGTTEALHLVHPVQDHTKAVVSCVLPLGRERLLQEWEHQLNLWLAGAAFLLTIGMAMLAARRYTAPLLVLSEGARLIESGDYRVRLAVGQDDEFGLLARHFNAMAHGVEEGRLLSRFVSESVREAAQSRDLEQQAQRGTSEEVVVVFVGLSTFSQLLNSLPPERLIDHLNRYLGVMARQIREQGGRIDKFIGDKILAVFRPRDFSGPAAAVQHAVTALYHMRQRMTAFRRSLPGDLGGGVVFGPVLSGIMGTGEVRREYTVIGDTVNLASRLCDLAMKQAGGGIVIDLATRDLLTEADQGTQHRLTRLNVNSVKGKTRQVDVFNLSDQDFS
ncbi:MAG TPA: adenylate/guanylate cyclase domain-containing protein, partial [Candidatus Ozemobacteraceae bacterium]|nr:adenylate/guanylate cyclase domain-containing protein [Candidatus Ozemobacteraceae bacterium]